MNRIVKYLVISFLKEISFAKFKKKVFPMVISKLWTSITPAYKKSAFSLSNKTQNFSGCPKKQRPNIFTPVNRLSISATSLFVTATINWIFLYQWTFYDLILRCLVQKPAWNCHKVVVSIQQMLSFNIFVLFHTFDTTMEKNAQPVKPS